MMKKEMKTKVKQEVKNYIPSGHPEFDKVVPSKESDAGILGDKVTNILNLYFGDDIKSTDQCISSFWCNVDFDRKIDVSSDTFIRAMSHIFKELGLMFARTNRDNNELYFIHPTDTNHWANRKLEL